MCNLKCSVATVIIGAILVVGSCVVVFVVVPKVVENIIISETALINDTIQLERFEVVPFAFNLSVSVFTISNPDEVLNGGVPVMTEVGPFIYKLYQTRNITSLKGDLVRYLRTEYLEFDAEASFPRTEDDMVTIINVPYHAIIQIAETSYSSLMPALNLALSNVFGEYNSPLMTVRVKQLLFEGVRICENPGIVSNVVCNIIRDIGSTAQNLAEQEDGSMLFSLLTYKNGIPSEEYEVYRGIDDHSRLGDIRQYAGRNHFLFWDDQNSSNVCDMINGTDSGIYAPFVNRDEPLYAINTDICRSVELRYQFDHVVDGIPAFRYATTEKFLANHEECFCLNVTKGITRENGCLLDGAMELYTCVGAMLVLTNPHFLYADLRYKNSIVGMTPDEEKHRIFIDIEPNTGTPIAGAKKAQFNIFQRAISGVPSTQSLRTALVPIVWIEESFELPDSFRDELQERLLAPLNLLDILTPVAIALCALVLLIGIICVVRVKIVKPPTSNIIQPENAK